MTGRWPVHWVDHIDRNKDNNKWENLREATPSQNAHNTKISKRNSSGTRGVAFDKNEQKWHAYIGSGKRRTNLGMFRDIDDAKAARIAAEIALIGEFSDAYWGETLGVQWAAGDEPEARDD